MNGRHNPESLPALKEAVRKLENDHESNPAMPQLKEILLKKIAGLEASRPEERESAS